MSAAAICDAIFWLFEIKIFLVTFFQVLTCFLILLSVLAFLHFLSPLRDTPFCQNSTSHFKHSPINHSMICKHLRIATCTKFTIILFFISVTLHYSTNTLLSLTVINFLDSIYFFRCNKNTLSPFEGISGLTTSIF